MPPFTKTQLAIPALIVLFAAGAGGSQIWGQRAARAHLDETLASLPPGSAGHYGQMSYNLFTQTLRIGDLTILRDGHPSLSIRTIVLHHLAGDGGATTPFRAAALRLEDVEVWRGAHSVTLALVQAQNIAVLAPGVPPPPGTPNWLVAPNSATLLAAGSVTADGIADDAGATLGALSISRYYEGQVQQASASSFADRAGDRITAGSADAIDLDGLDRVFDTGRYVPGAAAWAAPRLLIGHAAITGFYSQGKDGSGTLEGLTLDGFAARPFAAAPTTAYVKTGAFAQDAVAALSVGSASLTGLHVRDSPTKLSANLATLSAASYANGALAHLSLQGLSMNGQGLSQVSVGQFQLTGLDATKLLHQPPGEPVDRFIAAAGDGGFQLGGLSAARVSVTAPSGVPVSLTSLAETTSGRAPTQFTLSLRGLSIPAGADPELAETLTLLGIQTLVLDLDQSGSFDRAIGETRIKSMVLTAHGLGTLSLSAMFTHVPHDVAQTSSALAALAQIGIGPFTVQFTNDTLMQRVIAMQAKQSGKTAEEITDQARLAASFMATAVVPGQPDAGEQAAAFIADPKVITVTAAPASPVPLGEFSGPTLGAAQAALNLRISAQ